MTVLQISDMQYGENHRFVGSGLADSLLRDLAELRNSHGIWPNLVVIAGDLTENAIDDEYKMVYDFLVSLRDGLKLATERIVVVPGNHDVNRTLCKGYFISQSGRRKEPAPPYWPKWEPYADFHRRFYGTDFPKDEPWMYVELPGLLPGIGVAVAGLNSTIADSHLAKDRHGWLGDDQLRFFEDRMRRASERGWLRLGVMHHNLIRGTGHDDAYIHDFERFEALLARHLDLVLHGHTHNTRVQHFGASALPVLGSGSVGVTTERRPPEVPNQYQLVQYTDGQIRVWARRYDADRQEWVGDTSISENRNDWWRDLPKRTLLPIDDPRVTGRARHRIGDPARDLVDKSDSLLARVLEVCGLRLPQASITEVNGYLRVAVNRALTPDALPIIETYPIGVCDGPATPEDVDRFTGIDAVFRSSGPGVGSQLVYGGAPAPTELRERAALQGIELLSFTEYQMGYDLRPYSNRQAEDLAGDAIYPSDLYVPQRYLEVGDRSEPREDILNRLRIWLADPNGYLVAVLAPFGHGKTFLLRELARRMHEERDPAVPVLVHLRDLEKVHKLDELVASQLAKGGERRIDLNMFRYLLREGRIALLFDGFDELAVRVTYERAAEHLATIVQAAAGRAKVVFTSRDNHFLSDNDVLSALGNRLTTASDRRLIKLQPFDDDQISAFLTKRLGDQTQAQQRMQLLHNVRDLLGLSRNPRMLDFIAQITAERLIAAQGGTGEITAAALYRELLGQWLEYERKRLDRPGGPPPPSEEQLWHAVTFLALRLWSSGAAELGAVDLSLDDLSEAADALAKVAPERDESSSADRQQASHMIGSALLVRDGDSRFTFVHRSVMEWLVARHTADRLLAGDELPDTLRRPMSELMTDFLCDLAGRDTARAWADQVMHHASASGAISDNALLVLRRLGLEAATPVRLSGHDLRGRNFSGQPMRGADLSGADLTEAQFIGTDLTGANLTGARLVNARLDRARMTGSRLGDANLTGARLVGADLTRADLTRATLRYTALIGAVVAGGELDTANDVFGAALPGAGPPRPQFAGASTWIRAMAFSPDGQQLASGGDDGTIRLWNPTTGEQLRQLTGHTNSVWSVAFSPDGQQLASGGVDGAIRLWNPTTGEQLRQLTGHTNRVLSVAFSPDGQQLASGGDGTIRLWNPTTGEQLRQLTGHTNRVWSVAFSPDGQQLASGGDDGTIRLWNPTTGEQLRQLTGHTNSVWSVAFSPDGQQLASGDDDGTTRLWNPTTGEQLRQLTGHTNSVWSVAFSPDGQQLASGDDDGTTRLWNPTTGEQLRQLTGHTNRVWSVAFSPDGQQLASGDDDGTIRLWNPTTGEQLRQLTGHTNRVLSVAFSPDGQQLASGGDDGTIRLWNPTTGEQLRQLTGHTNSVWSVAFSPDGQQLASGDVDGTIRLWNPTTGEQLRQLTGHTNRVLSVAFSPDGQQLASGGDDGTIRLWNPTTGEQLRQLTGHTNRVLSVAFSPDGQQLASGDDDDGTIRLWNPTTGEQLRQLTGHTNRVWSVAFSPDGQQLASGGDDGAIRLWNPTTGEQLRQLTGHTNSVWSVAFSPDGQQLASGGDDGAIRLWNPTTGEQLRQLTGHTNRVWSVAFSPDGQQLASGDDDGTIRLWNPTTGQQLVILVPLRSGGWAALGSDLRYKVEGVVNGEFWYVIGLCRFEPGELDEYVPGLERLEPDVPFASAPS